MLPNIFGEGGAGRQGVGGAWGGSVGGTGDIRVRGGGGATALCDGSREY